MLCALLPAFPAQAATDIQIGDYLQMGTYYGKPILWRCVGIDENGPLMLSDKIISAKPVDAAGDMGSEESSHKRNTSRNTWGSNFWPDSNMRSWLNSGADAGQVEWLCGNPPDEKHVRNGYNEYDQEAGFLKNFTEEERGAIKEVTQKFTLAYPDGNLGTTEYTAGHTYVEDIEGVVSNYDTSNTIDVTDKVFLPDVKQLYAVYENREVLGDDYYIGEPTAECVENCENKSDEIAVGKKWRYWLRVPIMNYTANFRCVNPDGKITYEAAFRGDYAGIRPAFYLNQSGISFTSGTGKADDPYSIREDNTVKIGDYVQMGTYYGEPIIWRCVDIDENGPLMLSDKIISVKPMDAVGENNTVTGSHSRNGSRCVGTNTSWGSGYWADSNMRSWLNSDAEAGKVEWLCGNPPDKAHVDRGYNAYDQEAGFLTNFTQDEVGAMKEVTQRSILSPSDKSLATSGTEFHKKVNDIAEAAANYDTAYAEEVTDKMFLPNVKQVCAVYANSETLGEDYYIGEPTAECVENSEYKSNEIAVGKKWRYWLSTPNAEQATKFRYVTSPGEEQGVWDTSAWMGYIAGIRPAFYLDESAATFKYGTGSVEDPYHVRENTRAPFGGINETIGLAADTGKSITADLSKYMDYDADVDAAGKFTYTIDGENKINARIDGDILTVPEGLEKGEYSLTIKAAEKDPQYVYSLASVDGYGYDTVTLNVSIVIGIEIGDYVQVGTYYGKPVIWRCVSVDENGPLMLADKILTIKAYDAFGEANTKTGSHSVNGNRQTMGSNYWADSNIRSWLNSSAEAGKVEWLCGNPPDAAHFKSPYNAYDQEAGFLNGFTQDELGAVKEVTQKSILSWADTSHKTSGTELYRAPYAMYMEEAMSNYNTAYAEDVKDKIFLPDVRQAYDVYRNGDILGADYYIGEPTAECVEHNDYKGSGLAVGRKAVYALRTPTTDQVTRYYVLASDGRINYTVAYVAVYAGIRPAFYLNVADTSYKSGDGTQNSPYSVGGGAERVPFGGESNIELSADYGEGLTTDLAQYTAYENQTPSAGRFTYAIEGENTIGARVNGETLTIPKEIGAGEYTLKVKATEKTSEYTLASVDNYGYEPVILTIKIKIAKIAPTATVTANELVYKNAEQYLVTGKTTDGTLVYCLNNKDGAYSEKTPTGKVAGDYTVWYKIKGDANHTDSTPQSVQVSIKNIVGISIEKEPDNTKVLEGMPFDATGLKVIADCGNGETYEALGYMLSGYDTTKPGEQTVTVTYGGKTATFKITVEAKSLSTIKLTHKPDKLTYYQGDALDMSGMVITAEYNNNSSGFVDIKDCEISGSTDKVGEQTVSVKYGGQTVQFTVTVLERPAPTTTVEKPLIEIAEFYGGKRAILSCATEGADIYYTTDGSTPSASSQKYTAPIEMTADTELNAIAVKSGMNNSAVEGVTVSVEKVASPIASVPAGEVSAGTSVKLLCTTPGAEIYYTFGETLNEENYKQYTNDIVITEDTTIRVMAAKRGCVMSDGVTFTYTVTTSEDPGEENRGLLGVDDAFCKAGKTFSLPVYMYYENGTVSDFRFTLTFDSSKFEYLGFEPGESVPASALSVTASGETITVRASGDGIQSGEACALRFKVKDGVEADSYIMSVSDGEINVSDGSLIDIYYWDGLISVMPDSMNVVASAFLTDPEFNIIYDVNDVKGDITAWVGAEPVEIPENGEPINMDIIFAFYDKDGTLVNISESKAELNGEYDLFTTDISIPADTEIDSVKLMIWDDTDSMKPLTEAVPILP